MPYYRCWSCLTTSYNAAAYSTVGACPTCSKPLRGEPSRVPPEPVVRRSLTARPGAAAEARRALAELALPEAAREKLRLLVSELVTNSVRHGGRPGEVGHPVDLHVAVANDEVHLAVRDSGFGFSPAERPANGGFGLVLVDAIAKAWGVDCGGGDGCTVWCIFVAQPVG